MKVLKNQKNQKMPATFLWWAWHLCLAWPSTAVLDPPELGQVPSRVCDDATQALALVKQTLGLAKRDWAKTHLVGYPDLLDLP